MTGNRMMLASESPVRIGGLQFALCAAEVNFETAEWIENRRRRDGSFHFNGAEARRSMAHHHCGIGLEFAFKVLHALEVIAKGDGFHEKWTGHGLVDALGKIAMRRNELLNLYEEHCAGRLEPIAICVGRHPEYVEKANLDTLDGFCEYVDILGRWAWARYDHWQNPGEWMYRIADMGPVLKFGKAAVELANQAQEPVAIALIKEDEEIHVRAAWTQTAVKKKRTYAPQIQVVNTTESLSKSQSNDEL